MHRERIRAVDSWMGGSARYDVVFIWNAVNAMSISDGLKIARVKLFFSITLRRGLEVHTCALVHHFGYVGMRIDEDMGMWTVRPLFHDSSKPKMSIIPLDEIVRAAHLIPVYDEEPIPHTFSFTETLDHYRKFYVNKFVDYHAFEMAT